MANREYYDLPEKSARQIVRSAADRCTTALAAAHYVETKRSGLIKY